VGWRSSFVGLALALVVVPAAPPTPAARGELTVEVGHFPWNGTWYQDVYGHEHEKVEVVPKYAENGRVEVTVGLGGLSGTDVTLVFWRDEAKSTHVAATAIHRSDRTGPSGSLVRHLSGVEGRVLLQKDDWGPGRPLDCLFSVRAVMNEQPQLLLGMFNLSIPTDAWR